MTRALVSHHFGKHFWEKNPSIHEIAQDKDPRAIGYRFNFDMDVPINMCIFYQKGDYNILPCDENVLATIQ